MTENAAEIVGPSEQGFSLRSSPRSKLFVPHRIVLSALGAAAVLAAALLGRWDWLPNYIPQIVAGVWETLLLLVSSSVLGFAIAVPVGLVQVTGPWPLAIPARWFCIVIRGTPLLLQLWLLYYGLGSLFPGIPGLRNSFLWPYLRQAWPYAVLSLTLSFAGYEGEVMRGAFANTPRGELEAARAVGMSPWTLLRRVWLPLAILRSLPTLLGETVLQLKSTPLVATITVIDVYAVFAGVRQDTFIIYEPLLLLAAIYCCLTGLLVLAFRLFERRFAAMRR
ncbi:MAG TPA: ABC transporter permease subunit [Lichenihabitans sp.]|jgi:polar amino acid transport system permease protein|nr:ABC transporter permease subunit [Lichenihabitans sp.]